MNKILVVDDDPDILMIIEAALEDEGYRVIAVPEGRQALGQAVQQRVDAVLLDVNMPGMSGYEVLSELRADSRTRDLPILFLSARGATKDRIQGLREGADDYLTKPFELEELVLRLEKLLAQRAAVEESEPKHSAEEFQAALAKGSVDGLMLGRYELRRVIAEGAMGLVMLGWDPRLKREVAIKTIRYERLMRADLDRLLEELLGEAALVASLKHPHVVIVHDVEQLNDLVYVVMEYVEGPNLAALLHRRSTLSNEDTVALGLAMTRALRVAHQAGVVHRDIKPDNILLGKDSTIKVTDFGIANIISEPGKICGTPGFMPPELLKGEQESGVGDFFSLGAVLYFCLTGERPFGNNPTYVTLAKTLNDSPTPPVEVLPSVHPELSELVMDLLSKEPAHRPQDAAEVEERLLDIFSQEPRWSIQEQEEVSYAEEAFPTQVIGTLEAMEKINEAMKAQAEERNS